MVVDENKEEHRTASFALTPHRSTSSLFSSTTTSFSATSSCLLFILVDHRIVKRGKGGKEMRHQYLIGFLFLLCYRIALRLLCSCLPLHRSM
ncbi:hypothetical protein C4D60_Mb06t30740 [Musa balbisiana]|uniref:Transmembrane protein n=1 Tax=Musa balbisiana TaxID=52838 RepID=A0A4S8IRV9_MUSBA|nr:hypothetical protein C4D60_Mb06t30740 [Musa balbisiana]